MSQNQEKTEKPEPGERSSRTSPDAVPHHLGRNDPCHCGSGRKYKHCCLRKDEAVEREARAEVAAEAQEPAPEERSTPEAAKQRRTTDQPWKRGDDHRTFQRFQTPPKRGGG